MKWNEFVIVAYQFKLMNKCAICLASSEELLVKRSTKLNRLADLARKSTQRISFLWSSCSQMSWYGVGESSQMTMWRTMQKGWVNVAMKRSMYTPWKRNLTESTHTPNVAHLSTKNNLLCLQRVTSTQQLQSLLTDIEFFCVLQLEGITTFTNICSDGTVN